jgi:hypothetical protein
MDAVQTIVEALAAGALAGVGATATQAVQDAYAGLKALLLRKFGGQGDVAIAVEQVAHKPESRGRRHTLAEELSAADAGGDAEVLAAARALLDLLRPRGADQRQAATAEQGSAAATGGGASAVGNGNIQLTGDVQGGVTIYQGGWPAPAPLAPGSGAPVDTGGYDLQAVRDLLLAAFGAPELRRLFLYTSNPALRSLTQQFSPNDGLAAMADTAIQFCRQQRLLPDLLREVERANPRQYAHFANRLRLEGP